MQVSLEDFWKEVNSLKSGNLPDEAARYELFREYDPYESIPPALLHSGHLASYVITTGMIDPFDVEDLRKPATLLITLEGSVRYRDDEGNVQKFFLTRDPEKLKDINNFRDEVVIKPNSLYYLTLKPEFRIPSYIAGRFNLMIRDVYRGFLVGTGPLVDPGFHGKLSIPLHNFTNNEYTLRAEEGFVYFEFTKLSWKNPATPRRKKPTWVKSPIECQPPFPASKSKRKTLDNYLDEATTSGPAQSSIGLVIKNASKETEKATKETEKATKLFRAVTLGGTLAGLVSVASLTYTAWSLYASAQSFTLAAQTNVADSLDKINDKINSLTKDVSRIQDKMEKPSNSTHNTIDLSTPPPMDH